MLGEGKLYVFSNSKGWIDTEVLPQKYRESNKGIKSFLDSVSFGVDKTCTITISEGDLAVNIRRVQAHRGCTVCLVTQHDRKTDGYRYLVYGITKPIRGSLSDPHENYGIGLTLEYFSDKKVLTQFIEEKFQFFPNSIRVYHID